MPKAVTAASSVHNFWEVNPQWHRGAGEPEMGRALPKIKQTCEEMIDFIAKKVENMLRFKFWRWHLYFIFVSSGVEYCSRKGLLLANCLMKSKRWWFPFLYWSYERSWRRLLSISIRLSWNYLWLSCILRRLQQFWPWLGRLQGARWRTPTCLDGCCCLPSDISIEI